jgi:antitoxin (DNA-binding transcriptional repressor) of toxin-antitoxin stability system
LIAQVEATGEEVVIRRHNVPVAKLVPFRPIIPPRQLGGWGEPFELAADFDELPDDLAAGDLAADAPADPTTADWWDPSRLAYRDYAGSLDLGENWWPVDEGVEGDPAWFAVRWTAWIRVWDGGTVSVTLGSATDGYVLVNEQVFAAQPGPHGFAPETFTAQLAAGQYPLDVRSAQRGGDESAFRFRVLEGDVSVCYPEFSDEE